MWQRTPHMANLADDAFSTNGETTQYPFLDPEHDYYPVAHPKHLYITWPIVYRTVSYKSITGLSVRQPVMVGHGH